MSTSFTRSRFFLHPRDIARQRGGPKNSQRVSEFTPSFFTVIVPPRQRKTHYDTLTKAKVQEAYYYLMKHEIEFDPRDIFNDFGVSQRSGYEMIK